MVVNKNGTMSVIWCSAVCSKMQFGPCTIDALCLNKTLDITATFIMCVEGEGEETSNLRARYAASHLGQSNGKRTQELLQQYKSKQETKTNTSYKYATNILWQVSICTSSRV